MFYGYETSPQMPSMNVYDTSLMLAYIAGARELYNQAREDEKEFLKNYSDFVSPIAADNKAYHDATVGGAKNLIDGMYARGIDPFKSPEARAAITRYIASRPYGQLAQMRSNAKNAEIFNLNAAKLRAEGLLPDDWFLAQMEANELNNFQTVDPNTGQLRQWDLLSPTKLTTLSDITKDIYDRLEKTEFKGTSEDGRFDIYGVSNDDRAKAAASSLTQLKASPYYEYYKNKAGGTDQALLDLIDYTNIDRLQDKYSESEDYKEGIKFKYAKKLDGVRAANDVYVHDQKNASDYKWKEKEWTNPDNPKGINASSLGESYVEHIYNGSIGNLFGLDKYTASEQIANGTLGKNIYAKEVSICNKYKNDITKFTKLHTIKGETNANVIMLGVTTKGSVGLKGNKITLRDDQFAYSDDSDKTKHSKKIHTAEELAQHTAGYSNNKNKKDIDSKIKNDQKTKNKVKYFTVTDEIYGHLNKNGRYVIYAKVIGDNGFVGYYEMGVNSMQKRGGQAFSNKAIASREQPLGLDETEATARMIKDALATKSYTRLDSKETNAGAYNE